MRLFFAALTLLVGLQVSAGEIDQPAALSALQAPETLLIDVRTAEEFAAGALPGAARIATLAPEKDTVIVLYCRSGRRSSIAQDSLQALGYRNVINAGGYEQLEAELEAQD